MAHNNRSVFSHTSGGQKSKINVWQGHPWSLQSPKNTPSLLRLASGGTQLVAAHDIVIYNKYIFGLSSIFGMKLLMPLEFLSWKESDKGIFCYVNEVAFECRLPLKGAGCQENQGFEGWIFHSHLPDLQGEKSSLRLNQLPMANELINHVCIMKPPQKKQKEIF